MISRRFAPSSSYALLVAALTAATLAVAPAAAADTKMKDVMKQIGKTSATETDATKLVPLLLQAKGMSPTLPEMGPLFDASIAAAKAGDMKAANATCGSCHKTQRDAYKTKYGSKAP